MTRSKEPTRSSQGPAGASAVRLRSPSPKPARARGRVAKVAPADLGDPDEVPQAIAAIVGELGGVDILINNAAVVRPLGPTLRTDPHELQSAFAINVFAPMTLARALVPDMLDRGWGRVINISSGIVGRPNAMLGMNVY